MEDNVTVWGRVGKMALGVRDLIVIVIRSYAIVVFVDGYRHVLLEVLNTMTYYIIIDGKDICIMEEKDIRIADFHVDHVLRVTAEKTTSLKVELVDVKTIASDVRRFP